MRNSQRRVCLLAGRLPEWIKAAQIMSARAHRLMDPCYDQLWNDSRAAILYHLQDMAKMTRD